MILELNSSSILIATGIIAILLSIYMGKYHNSFINTFVIPSILLILIALIVVFPMLDKEQQTKYYDIKPTLTQSLSDNQTNIQKIATIKLMCSALMPGSTGYCEEQAYSDFLNILTKR